MVSDQVVSLGAGERSHHGPVRVVRIEKEGLGEPLILVTNRLDPGTHLLLESHGVPRAAGI